MSHSHMNSEFQFSQEGHSQNIFFIHGASSTHPPPQSQVLTGQLCIWLPLKQKALVQSCGSKMGATRDILAVPSQPA